MSGGQGLNPAASASAYIVHVTTPKVGPYLKDYWLKDPIAGVYFSHFLVCLISEALTAVTSTAFSATVHFLLPAKDTLTSLLNILYGYKSSKRFLFSLVSFYYSDCLLNLILSTPHPSFCRHIYLLAFDLLTFGHYHPLHSAALSMD